MRDLVERSQRGDLEAFAGLVSLVSARLYSLAYRVLRDADLAEDAFQAALLNVWRQLPTLRDADRFEAWARRLLVRACYAELGRKRAWAAHTARLTIEGPPQRDETVSVDDRDTLERAFRRLTVEQRAVFVLHHHFGLPLTEIAESLGIPTGTARSRLHYATRLLRQAVMADAAPVASEGRTA